MRTLTAGLAGEIFSETAQGLIRWGMAEREAYMLATVVRLTADATDATCENAVILALIAARRSGRLLNIFCFLGQNGPFEVISADESLPLTDSRLASYVESSPVRDAMDYYEDEMTRENYIATTYVGSVGPDDTIPGDVEDGWPMQFRRKALLHADLVSGKIQ
jgi:hypothetical protein